MLERAVRGLAFAILAWLVWSATRPASRARSVQASIGNVPRHATEWARDAGLASMDVEMDATPEPRDLNMLAALARAGTAVTWNGAVAPLGVTAERVPDPMSSTRVSLAGAPGAWLHVSDRLGALDSVKPNRDNAQLLIEEAEPPIRATSGGFSAVAASGDSLILRPVLVIGGAGWESKFVVAALEERGWHVATQIAVAPGARVGQGSAALIDTARYAAIVVLDTSGASWAQAIGRYVHAGGGLVLAGRSASIPAFASLAPATLGAHRAARPALVADSVTPRALAHWALATPRNDAAALARFGSELAVAARVVGAGRVAQTGSEETWRWRMEGAEGSASAHREWWSRLVAAVAYAPSVSLATHPPMISAPRAQIIDALGEPRRLSRVASRFDPLHSPIVITVLLALLLAEWASRRLRGAR